MSKYNPSIWILAQTKEKPAIMSKIQKHVQATLAHVKHITIIIKQSPIDSNAITRSQAMDDNMFFATKCLADFLPACQQGMPNLKSLRIALYRPHAQLVDDKQLGTWMQPGVRDCGSVLTPPEEFGSLKMQQSGEGYVIGFGRTWQCTQISELCAAQMLAERLPAIPVAYSVDGWDFGLSHEVHMVAVYTYCREDKSNPEKMFWTEGSVMEMLKEECGVELPVWYPGRFWRTWERPRGRC
jgi:hypothetical protein